MVINNWRQETQKKYKQIRVPLALQILIDRFINLAFSCIYGQFYASFKFITLWVVNENTFIIVKL